MVYLIPTLLSEDAKETMPTYVMECVRKCNVFFAENLRTARRFLKKMDTSIVIDNYEWYEIGENEKEVIDSFKNHLKKKSVIGILSEAGCPGVADPGQILVNVAQEWGETVRPLVGPSSILLALMASGMNGQHFTFNGYLPVKKGDRIRKLKQLEEDSGKRNCTQIFIETPYRNESLLADIIETCNPKTLLCIGCEITGKEEWIKTLPISKWKKEETRFHKKTAIFLIQKKY